MRRSWTNTSSLDPTHSYPLGREGSAEGGGPENAGLDFEGPFRRSIGIVCSEVV